MSKVYSLQRKQIVNASLQTVWDFFSAPNNLEKITPKSMAFDVISKDVQPMYAGQIIEYKVTPLLGIKLYWMTEIMHVEPLTFFVDEQRFGPFSFWHHQHHFKQVANGVEMTDILHYKIPFWFIGDIANAIMVKKKIKEIFDFREQKVNELFSVYKKQL